MINYANNYMYEFTCVFYIQYVMYNKNVLLTIGKFIRHSIYNVGYV